MPTRAAIIAEVESWIGTPYRHQASCKGVGTDCLGLVRGVWRGVYGDEPEETPPYTDDWAEATGLETLAEAAARHMDTIARDDMGAGDVLLFRMRAHGPAKHAGLMVSDQHMVHAHSGLSVARAQLSPAWRRRIAFIFRFPGIVD